MKKCGDCGDLVGEIKTRSQRGFRGPVRADICDGCWETRKELVKGNIVPLDAPYFIKIQKAMGSGRGTAKRLIDKVRKEA